MSKVIRAWAHITCALLISTLFAQPIAAQEDARPKIGLVLSGGGARGAAHVGVLKVLEENRVPIDMIAGTSFGAIVGGLYASGYSADDLQNILDTIDWQEALSNSAPRKNRSFRRKEDDDGFLIKLKLGIKDGDLRLPTGFVKPNNLRLTLRDLLSPVATARHFDDLMTPFRAVATDLETGLTVPLEDGDLTSAMLASMAVPALFPPVQRDGHLLVDGGVSNNVPIDVVRAMGADIVIVVDISTPLQTKDDITSLTSVINQLSLILTNQSAARQLATLTERDVIIRPDLSGIGVLDFENAIDAVPRGTSAALDVAAQLRPYTLPVERWQAHLDSRTLEDTTEPVIDFIRIVNETEVSDDLIASRLSLKPGDTLDSSVMSDELSKIYGLDLFEEVTYSVVEENGQTGVEIQTREPDTGESFIRFGLALQDDFEGETGFQFAAAYTDLALNSRGGELSLLLNLGDTMGLSAEYYQPIDYADRTFAFATLLGQKTNRNLIDRDGRFISQVRVSQAGLQAGTGVNFGQWGSARVGLERTYGNVKGRIGFPADIKINFDETALIAAFSIDTLDGVFFPQNGIQFGIEYENNLSWLNGDSRADTLFYGGYFPTTWGKNTFGLISRFATTFNGEPTETDLFPLGGFLSMTAYSPGQLTGNHGGSAGAIYYRRISGGPRYLAQTPIYLGALVETGNVWNDRSDMSLNDLRWSSGVFVGADTMLGPVYLGAAVGDRGQTSAFLYVGQLF